MEFFDTTFWQGFLGNLLATILGVAIGIPVAFWINRRVETNTEKEKKSKILTLLMRELETNHDILVKWRESGSEHLELTTMGGKLSHEIWNAFSDGGELQWINDPFLLAVLADAYEKIKAIKYFSNRYFDFNSLPDIIVTIVVQDLRTAVREGESRIREATQYINSEPT